MYTGITKALTLVSFSDVSVIMVYEEIEVKPFALLSFSIVLS